MLTATETAASSAAVEPDSASPALTEDFWEPERCRVFGPRRRAEREACGGLRAGERDGLGSSATDSVTEVGSVMRSVKTGLLR